MGELILDEYAAIITITYLAIAELVALCDLSQTRMDWYNRRFEPARPTYHVEQFEQMIAETRPDTVIVATMDSTHHLYIIRAMEMGCDVITEKPMTTDLAKLRAIFAAIEQTGRSLRVTFNYRYAPAYTQFRELIMQGVIGRPFLVDFSWILDTSHGADYFRRWRREKENSGGLLVHKATHHFDLVNWWIDSYPAMFLPWGRCNFTGGKMRQTEANTTPTGATPASRKPKTTPLPSIRTLPISWPSASLSI